jgi:hypothetical protein
MKPPAAIYVYVCPKCGWPRGEALVRGESRRMTTCSHAVGDDVFCKRHRYVLAPRKERRHG